MRCRVKFPGMVFNLVLLIAQFRELMKLIGLQDLSARTAVFA